MRTTIQAVLANNYLRFFIINLLILALTGPVVVLYGPFQNIKSSVVGAIMTSRHPHWITWLLSDKEIKAIIGDSGSNIYQRQSLFHFTKRQDDTLRLVTINGTRFNGYLLEIPDPSRVKVATARDIQEIGDTVSTIALNNNAIAAINAGGFHDPNGTGTGRLPYGLIIHEGKYLVGGDIKDAIDLVGFTKSGVLVAGKYTPQEIKELQVAEAVTFGPPLIINGKKMITSGDGGWGVAPRTAIGQRKDGTVLFLVIDGRQPSSIGATLLDIQNILYEQGAYVAANLDGGSSTTLFYNGKVVNKPCDMLGERMIPTAFIVR
ncbi:MAG: phosphodiester glycosidase family protein [Negativicutes bacterium]|nr:phosphodiester glycosidase family protein [Negativicutes bacterium]